MSRSINLSLRGHERIFINGAVLRVDRKVTIELLNDATFLLEAHVLQAEQATTPIRQLYFIAQAMLIDPGSAGQVRVAYHEVDRAIVAQGADQDVASALATARSFLDAGRPFEVLRILRSLFQSDDLRLGRSAGMLTHQVA
ncbi:flagellar biosynthesis repressor FlbT [Methylobacterium longum]|uniref:Flagellar biosynthesis repressor FlbT n=1 Tax=Methylobacterium longum TaxID=767694 RepID=A0ABT8AP90_9HYPH|nr:flagellar biosynthesis repressor FlbT [Methylobacterium longum]MDN3571656.1 flagellar biosynthesis repressor FlbT [Methylobacterium longum]GJE11680.1 flagellum biosynthesis repressor protein FlbT [Methylobacterium longum]